MPPPIPTAGKQCPTTYRPRRPAETVLYRVVQQHFETWLMLATQSGLDYNAVPKYVEQTFHKYLETAFSNLMHPAMFGLLQPPH